MEEKDLIVLGAGAAGMSASIYAARRKIDTALITKDFGGQIANTDSVENYLGFKKTTGPDLVEKFEEHVREYEDIVEIIESKVISIEKEGSEFIIEYGKGNKIKSKAAIISLGGKRRKLNVPGEDEYSNRGLSYCAICDGPLYQDDPVAIVGGGYAGTEAAVYMSEIADKIYIVNVADSLSGEEITMDSLEKKDNIEAINQAKVTEIIGDDFVTGLRYEKDGSVHQLDVTGIFVEIGTIPNTGLLEGDLVELNEDGYIKVDQNMKTSTAGLFAAGDITDIGQQQIVISAAQGATAALEASEYLDDVR